MVKPVVYLLLALVVLFSISVHTKPCREQHLKEVAACIMEAFRNDELLGTRINGKVLHEIEDRRLVQEMLDKMLHVDDCMLFSLCKIRTGNDDYLLSIGVLGGVIVLQKKAVAEKVLIKLRERRIVD